MNAVPRFVGGRYAAWVEDPAVGYAHAVYGCNFMDRRSSAIKFMASSGAENVSANRLKVRTNKIVYTKVLTLEWAACIYYDKSLPLLWICDAKNYLPNTIGCNTFLLWVIWWHQVHAYRDKSAQHNDKHDTTDLLSICPYMSNTVSVNFLGICEARYQKTA